MDIFTALFIGAGGAVIALVFEQLYLHFKEKQKENRQKLITFPNDERKIPESVFQKLSPGSSIELMKYALGTPNKIYKDYEPVFTKYRFEGDDDESDEDINENEEVALSDEESLMEPEENKFTYAYFYEFKNAYLKVTSKDRETIDSLAVEVKEGKLTTGDLPLGWGENEDDPVCILGSSKVSQDLIDVCRPETIQSRFDYIFVLSLYTGAPLYTYYTYFGIPEGASADKKHPERFIDSTITGICLHSEELECHIITSADLM
jgi:hypothetical protein